MARLVPAGVRALLPVDGGRPKADYERILVDDGIVVELGRPRLVPDRSGVERRRADLAPDATAGLVELHVDASWCLSLEEPGGEQAARPAADDRHPAEIHACVHEPKAGECRAALGHG